MKSIKLLFVAVFALSVNFSFGQLPPTPLDSTLNDSSVVLPPLTVNELEVLKNTVLNGVVTIGNLADSVSSEAIMTIDSTGQVAVTSLEGLASDLVNESTQLVEGAFTVPASAVFCANIDGSGGNDFKLSFTKWTSSANKIYTDNNCNDPVFVGVNNKIPQHNLDVIGDMKLTTSYQTALSINHTTNSDYSYATQINVNRDKTKALALSDKNDDERFILWGNGSVNARRLFLCDEYPAVPNSSLIVKQIENDGILKVVDKNDNSKFVVDGKGQVGIGNENPKDDFQIGDRFAIHAGNNNTWLSNNIYYDYSDWKFKYLNTETGASMLLLNQNKLYYRFYNGGDENTELTGGRIGFSVNKDGTVGVNTDYPSASLEVKGVDNNEEKLFVVKSSDGTTHFRVDDDGMTFANHIKAKEVTIELGNFPDYVFEKDYNLMPLSEVEQHIKKEGHLPNIPSAAEVEENGIGVGELQTKLLEKIEELTLHMIQQQKDIEQQQKRLEKLEKENGELKKQLSK